MIGRPSISPCPVCGNRPAKVIKRGVAYYVHCSACTHNGPAMPAQEGAVTAWNDEGRQA